MSDGPFGEVANAPSQSRFAPLSEHLPSHKHTADEVKARREQRAGELDVPRRERVRGEAHLLLSVWFLELGLR